MSALAKQLAAIAANSTHQLDLKSQRSTHGKSLLFEAKVAVSQDFDTLFQICYEGWEDLCTLDRRFVLYANSLFSEQSKGQERGQMSAAQSKEVDLVLQSFLGLVSSRLLLKPAQKAVEWLIRRFQVHEYNTQDLLLAFLPYYSTPIFVTLMSILPSSRLPPTFRFLQPYISSLKNPPPHAVLYAASNNSSFFSAFNQHILRIAQNKHHSPALMSFWSSIVSQAVDSILTGAQSGISSVRVEKMEAALLQILPIVNDALAIKDVSELGIGSCMIITILAARADLQDTVIQSLMEAVASTWSQSNADARIICLASLAQSGNVKKLSKSVSKKLLALEDLIERLEVISGAYEIERLLLALLFRCIDRFFKSGKESDLRFIEDVLQRDLLSQQSITSIIKKLLTETFSFANAGGEYSERDRKSIRQGLANIFSWLSASPLAISFAQIVHKKKFDLSKLDTALHITISATVKEDESEDDEILPDIANEDAQDRIDISSLTLTDMSRNDSPPLFLQRSTSPTFLELCEIFVKVSGLDSQVQQFLSLPVLRKKDMKSGDPTFVSFLLRVACSNLSLKLRLVALNSLTRTLENIGKRKVDYHIVTPYIMHTLEDPSRKIRQAGAQCLVEISKGVHLTESHKIWARESFYLGIDKQNFVLTSPDARIFVSSVLLPNLEEFILDQTSMSKLMRAALSRSSSSSKGSLLNPSTLELKSATRNAITEFLAAHSAITALLPVQITLLQLISSLGKSASAARTSIILPATQKWVSQPFEEVEKYSTGQGITIKAVNAAHFSCITPRDHEGLEYLSQIFQTLKFRPDALVAAHDRLSEIWRDINQEARGKLLTQILRTALSTPTDDIGMKSREIANLTLRSISLLPEDLVHLVEHLPSASAMTEGPATKRRRITRSEALKFELAPQDTMVILREYTLVLEIIELSKPADSPQLLKGLFNVLRMLQNFAIQTDSNLGYLKGLTVNSLLQIVDKLKDNKETKLDRSSIRTDLVVDTIQATTNAQLQNSCLLLISCLAMWMPDAVLHSVMPIFTFMGNTILRQGDDYSAHVIDQTVSRVIPPLVSSLRKRSRVVVSGVADLLISFTAAFEHIPLHRRLKLFELLVNALGPQDCLFAVIVLIIDRHPTDSGITSFIIELMNLYSAEIDLNAFKQCVDLICDIFNPRRGLSSTLLNLKDKPSDEVHSKASNLLEVISELLASSSLRNKIIKSFYSDETLVLKQQESYSGLISASIRLTRQLKDTSCADISKKFLSTVFRLLPTAELISAADSLLDNNHDDIRDVVISSISAQCKPTKQGDTDSIAALLSFIPKATFVVTNTVDDAQKYNAIACIDRITTKFGKKDPPTIISAAEVIIGQDGLGSRSPRIKIISLLTISSVIEALKEEMLPLAPKMLGECFSLLLDNLQSDSSNQQLQHACFKLLIKTAEHLPFILSADKLDNAIQLTQLSATRTTADKTDIQNKFYSTLAHNISASEMFSAVERNYDVARRKQGLDPLLQYYKLVKQSIEYHSKSEAIKNATVLFKFLTSAFELRYLVKSSPGEFRILPSETDELETVAIDIALSFILKLNDATFRPFFIHLVEWAAFKPTEITPQSISRAITFFQFTKALVHRLKALVTNYMSYVLEFVTVILTKTTDLDNDEGVLLNVLLSVLSESFEYDDDDFWQSPSHFAAVAEPLVLQLDRCTESIATTRVIPAITALCYAASSADHFKAINTKILQLMRSDSAAVRLTAVKCERSLTDRHGEDWLALLPEMLPFIVELLEDDDEMVEKETRTWIRSVEDILGESLEGMLQ